MKFKSTDLGKEITIKDFFKELLITLFKEGEYSDDYGFTDWDYDSKEVERKILELIKEL